MSDRLNTAFIPYCLELDEAHRAKKIRVYLRKKYNKQSKQREMYKNNRFPQSLRTGQNEI